ncbi:DUF2225 domain-containing protein [Entomospira culicis]|uniref:DUF2225 domain-containing protein n=1 Tax=Entomospira culicis TaxID=2719989 RepID=A0A968KWD1_9SPIO|nr:DUF2225 domain-containing protein [Entomospira culicis]NIZ18852.1 DUF2225 domain-containing protein [Entomospira culicis]NIZ69067.1 DUF2225 domain-containing protein [Entomospira culicis]WDI37654.1 DUF2225 domain-containing protein [Entomospira culicis]WDI39282.1 DUF2225 domain-containing protein [Entomospira culicis]
MSDIPKVTYFAKNPLTCPICGHSVIKEELLSGSGRLIAGDLTDELHRKYEKTKKFGTIYPLTYVLPHCSSCHFTAFTPDWQNFKLKMSKQLLMHEQKRAYEMAESILGPLNFDEPRRLEEGIASYLIALFVYEQAAPEMIPIFKQALVTLRGAWLASYLAQEDPEKEETSQQLSAMLYRKAAFYYRYSCELEETTSQGFTKLSFQGPDQDNNFGFDGVLYLAGLLEFKYGQRNNPEARLISLNSVKTIISKIVGSGKASKSKPKDILDLARSLYAAIKAEVESLEHELSKE